MAYTMYPRGHNHWRSQDFSARERSDQVGRGCVCGGGVSPSHGREIFEKFVYQNDLFCTLNVFLFFNLLYSPINGGGGGHGTLCPP